MSKSCADFEERLKKVVFNDVFRKIKFSNKEVNVFKILGVQHKENTHSNIFAELLRKDTSLIDSKSFFQDIFAKIAYRDKTVNISDVSKLLSCDFDVHREKFRIDILLEDWTHKVVVGIENKIYHHEREDQISDYQQILNDNYQSFSKYMIFLTPEGVKSKTVNMNSSVPCWEMSYLDIYDSLENYVEDDDTNLIYWLRKNIEREIIMNKEEKKLVAEVWSDYETAMTLRDLYKNMPKLEDIKNDLTKRIEKTVGSKLYKSAFPKSRGEVKELKYKIKDWCDKKGLHFTFMFYFYDERPCFRVFIYDDDYNEHIETLNEFMNNADESFDKNMPKTKGWGCWRRVFQEADHPEESYLNDFSFSQKTVDSFMQRFEEAYIKIKKIYDSY